MIGSCSLFFVRHGKLLLPYKSHDEMPFKVLVDLALEKLNPPIDRDFTLPLIKDVLEIIPFRILGRIYTSPSRRCQKTAKLISSFISQTFRKKPEVSILKGIQEIEFDLEKIYHPPNHKKFNIEAINNSVFAAMIDNKHCESVHDAYNRIEKVFKILKKNKKEKVLLVTHDFIMRVIEIYIKNQGKDNPSIAFEDLKNTKRNLYLRGFATDYSFTSFFPF